MACNITIDGVFGLGDPLSGIRITGTAEDCPPDQIEGGSPVIVGVSCRSADGPFTEIGAEMQSDGTWEAIFPAPPDGCGCDETVFVNGRCATVEGCRANPVERVLNCFCCPTIDFRADDASPNKISTSCDPQGRRLVSIKVFMSNQCDTGVMVDVDCGPGGTKVDGASIGLLGGASASETYVCRYDPMVTPNPNARVKFLTLIDFQPHGCPPVPIPVGTLDVCGDCATALEFEVSRDGQVVDPESVVCLPSGDYDIKITAPATQGANIGWSVDGQSEPETSDTLTVTLAAGQAVDVTAAMVVQGCPLLSGSVDLEACLDSCPEGLDLVVQAAGGAAVDLSTGCLPPGTYTVVVTNPVPPPWTYVWTINGIIDTTTNGPAHTVDVPAGATASVRVEASAPGCQTVSNAIGLEGCTSGGGGGGFGCDGLLIAAITALIIGGILIVVGVCTGNGIVTGLGIASAVVGLVLLALWVIFCRTSTSCSVLASLRCLLNWLVILALFVSVLMAIFGSLPCAATAALTGVSWGSLSVLLTDVMVSAGCKIGTCLLPSSTGTVTRRSSADRRGRGQMFRD
ncbi:hypothetical protein [Jannaschia aquimarina]|uniref:Uncharacterized protein n=1 Tax=Jannaschia aquimarina TaxID=935700 RepID=A0A0D1DDN3_9RHOB|nr:hypothetical protein [Jannaschia aquimarina]KIT18103.1 hypothetical protein jaqu_01230 [Jannaschia aquimarina]SNT40869.1 hypothetical protein SAMN05421775_11620 [Jannaschia aquimarina]